MKKNLIILSLALFLFCLNEIVAETIPLIEITKNDTLQIMVNPNDTPRMFLNKNGQVEGFYVELDKAVMKEMGQKYNLVAYSNLVSIIQKLRLGTAHSVLGTAIMDDYKSLLNISIPFQVMEFVIFIKSDSNIVFPDNKEEAIKILYGKKVGVQTRGLIYKLLRDHKEIEIISFPTTEVAMEALHYGEVDAVPEVKEIGKYYSNQNNWNVKPGSASIFEINIGTGFSKKLDISIVDRYNTALKTLIDSGYVDNLYYSYFGE